MRTQFESQNPGGIQTFHHRVALLLFVVASLAITGCVQKNEKEEENRTTQPVKKLPPGQVKISPEEQAAAGILIGTVETRPLPEVFAATAQIEVPTGRSGQVMSPVLGYAEAPPAGIPAIGTEVERGRVMALVREGYSATDRLQLQVDMQDADAAIKTAQAQRELAQSQVERSRRLYRDKIAPLKQVQQDEAALKTAEAAYESATERRKNYSAALSSARGGTGPALFSLTAPISGFVVSADITPGQLVDPSHPLFSIVDTRVLWIKVSVPEAELGSIGRANSGELTVSAYPGKVFQLRRVASLALVDNSTHTATLIYACANEHSELKPGMVAGVALHSSRVIPRLAIPESALVHEASATVVFVQVGQDTFQRLPVSVTFADHGWAAIEKGLTQGQRIVAAGGAILESQLQRRRIQETE